jgi:hypothetical protein
MIRGQAGTWAWGQGRQRPNSKGNRRPDDWLGAHFQVSGLGNREPGSGVQVRVQVQELNLPGTRTCT